jgi:hypothetical protein
MRAALGSQYAIHLKKVGLEFFSQTTNKVLNHKSSLVAKFWPLQFWANCCGKKMYYDFLEISW